MRPGPLVPVPAEEVVLEARSMPLEDAMESEAMLVYEINGQPLPVLNGVPVRLVGLAGGARHGYYGHVMRSANIADLRNHLTQYLREVREGEEIIVCDRRRPIAKIVPLAPDEDAQRTELVAAGLMRPASDRVSAGFWRVRRSPVAVRTAVDALSADRDDG